MRRQNPDVGFVRFLCPGRGSGIVASSPSRMKHLRSVLPLAFSQLRVNFLQDTHKYFADWREAAVRQSKQSP